MRTHRRKILLTLTALAFMAFSLSPEIGKTDVNSFQILQTIPDKIFTPNGDGVNDVIEFIFDNPSDSVISKAKIYDLTGAEVSDLKVGSTGTSYIWDGRNKNGETVHGDVYIYQIEAGGKVFNGTVMVAKWGTAE